MDELQTIETRHVAEEELRSQIDLASLPQHVAIIMDGNGRWATERGLPRLEDLFAGPGLRLGAVDVRRLARTGRG